MVQESFEEVSFQNASASVSRNPLGASNIVSLQSVENPDLYIRHCNYILWQTEQIAPASDFVFKVVNALNGQSGAVSFQSTNFPTYFLSLATASGLTVTLFSLHARG